MQDTYVEYHKDITTGDIVFNGRISNHDMVRVRLDNFDNLVLNTRRNLAADTLQDFELLFRKIEEQLYPKTKEEAP